MSYIDGDTDLCLVQAPQQHLDAGCHRKRVGLNQLAFHGQPRAHIHEIAVWVRTAGFTSLYHDRHPFASGPNDDAMYCQDPIRMKVEVVAPPLDRPLGSLVQSGN